MNIFNLTPNQEVRADSIRSKLRDKVLTGSEGFSLNNSLCFICFGVENRTRHAPLCYVKGIIGDAAGVEGIFFGDGIMSHPVCQGTLRIDLIPTPPLPWKAKARFFFERLFLRGNN